MNFFKEQIIEILAEQIEMENSAIDKALEVPPNPEMGDYAFPCFPLSKLFRKAPNIIAQELKDKIRKIDIIEKIESVGGYLNFFINDEKFASFVINKILAEGKNYGSSKLGEGKTIVVDFCATNIAKPFHIGHLATTMIGNSLYKIHKFLGYDCVSINHIGDWGTQFGKLIVAYKKWGNRETIEANPIKELMNIYVKFHEEAEKDESLNDEGRAAFKAIEDGVSEYVELWKWFREVSIKEFKRVLKILNVEFDSWNGESFYNDKMDKVIAELRQKDLLVESQGAQVVDLTEANMPPCIVLRSDGATLYATRDLAAIFYRKENYDFDKALYCVATQQNLHFNQIFEVVELMGYEWAKDLVHVANGMISLETGAMSTRKGNVVFLEDVLNEAVSKSKAIIEERNPGLENKDEIASKVGIGAVIFSVLYNKRIKDSVFVWDKVLNFDGETSCYIQYTYARICSVFRKIGTENIEKPDYSLLNDSDAQELIALLSRFPEAVQYAASEYEPSNVSRALIEIVQSFNKFYHNNTIIHAEPEQVKARWALCKAVKTVIENGTALLGIECPDRM